MPAVPAKKEAQQKGPLRRLLSSTAGAGGSEDTCSLARRREAGESQKEGDGQRDRVRLDHRACISREWGLGLAVYSEAMQPGVEIMLSDERRESFEEVTRIVNAAYRELGDIGLNYVAVILSKHLQPV